MPIIDKIDRAKRLYAEKLAEFQKAAEQDRSDTGFEKELMIMLAEMIEIKTEIEILTRVDQHRNST